MKGGLPDQRMPSPRIAINTRRCPAGLTGSPLPGRHRRATGRAPQSRALLLAIFKPVRSGPSGAPRPAT